MSKKTYLSEDFMNTVPILLRKKGSKQKQLQIILYVLQEHSDQFEQFIEKFGWDRYHQIMPLC